MAVAPGQYRFGPRNGRLLLRTGRQGMAGALGHDLTLEVTSWSAEVEVGSAPAAVRVEAQVDLDSLTVVEGRGGATPLTPANRRDIATNARKALDVARFPEAVFAATGIDPSAPAVEGTLTLHGRSAPQRLDVEEAAPGRYRARATVVQSRFGITPYSAMFGALRVRDDVAFEVEVDLGA